MASNFKHADHLVTKIEQALKELEVVKNYGTKDTIEEQFIEAVEVPLNNALLAANALKRRIVSN